MGGPRDALPDEAARAIRELMAGQGVSQREVARELGVTETTFSRWLSRTQGVPLGALKFLAGRLGVPLGVLLGAPPRAPATGDAGLAAVQARLEALTRAMHEAVRLVPVYRDGDAGDPRGEDAVGDLPPASPAGYVQVPPASERALGLRGFAVAIDHERLAGRGVWPGDLCFANPDAQRWQVGSLVVAVVEGRLRLCEIAAGAGGRFYFRTAPLSGPPEELPGPIAWTVGPVLRVLRVARLKHGLGNADVPPGGEGREPQAGVQYDVAGNASSLRDRTAAER